jgi:hypothetical protein
MSERFSGLGLHLGNLSRLSDAKSRSISPENPTGDKGKGGMAEDGTGAIHARGLGRGWKISPSKRVAPGETLVLGEIEGAGAIQQIWITPANVRWRDLILRIYWDAQQLPSVEAPLGDFFACGWGRYAQVTSLAVCVNPGRALNCYWEMPFRRGARLTLENRDPESEAVIYWQINYALTDVPEGTAYFHAQFRRTNPLPFKQDYMVLDDVRGRGHYVGTYVAWGVNNSGWWGEGEIKFFLDGATNGRRSAAPALRTTSAAPTISTPGRSIRLFRAPTRNSRHPIPDWPRSSVRTEPISRSSASASIVGTSWIRSASRRTSR